MPSAPRMVMKGYEVIDGKRYKVWQAWAWLKDGVRHHI
jgi:hypothetical protein